MLAVATLLIEHLDELWAVGGPAPLAGQRQGGHAPIRDAAIAADGADIIAAGTTADVRAAASIGASTKVVDGRGRSLVPGFVDGHTHVAFAGDRREELRRRLGGATYAEIAAAGGGIVSTVRATRAASDDQIVADTRRRLDEMLHCGTTTCEAKSGYALTVDGELKMLRALRRLAASHDVEIVPTFMGAHEVPIEYRDRRRDYIDLVVREMIPAVARERLAEWCDVFCEDGVFTPEETCEILLAGRRAGMMLRVHADELGSSGGSRIAAQLGVRSADHLIFVDEAGADGLAAAGVVATLLPVAAFSLKLGRFAPARMLIERGVAVALATDVNPGGGFSPAMPFTIALACFGMGLTFEEALVAATINGAYSIDRHARVGSLEPGKQMDAVVIDGPAIDLIRVGAETIAAVVKKGRLL